MKIGLIKYRFLMLPRYSVVIALLAALVLGWLSDRVGADVDDLTPYATGDLDPAFGSGGTVTTDFAGSSDDATGVLIQPDGKIVVTGSSFNATVSSLGYALARYSADGSPDNSFGIGGKVVTPFGFCYTSAIQPDGKIVLAGQSGLSFAFARYNQDGSLDASFGTGGKVTTRFEGKAAEAYAIAILPDGRIVLAGHIRSNAALPFTYDFALTRYNHDGSLDTTFGNGGRVITDFNSNDDIARGVAIQPDGKLIVAGETRIPGSNTSLDIALARYLADGSLDSSFGTGGRVAADFGRGELARALAIQGDGRVVVAGLAFGSGVGNVFCLARFNTEGTVDSSFGENGNVLTIFPGGSEAVSLAIQPDGRLVAGGTAGADFAVARYNADGSLDPAFGSGGKAVTDFGGKSDQSFALALQPNGYVVVAGRTGLGTSNRDFAVSRYQATIAGFSLALNSATLTASPGDKRKVTVEVTRTGGFAGGVEVTASDTSAIKVRVIPQANTPEGTSFKFKLKIKGSAPRGTHDITFTGTDSSGRRSLVVLGLTIQ